MDEDLLAPIKVVGDVERIDNEYFEEKLADAIANEWVNIETTYTNKSLIFCYKIKKTLEENPAVNAKNIAKKLSENPKVSNISTQRLWDNLRMMNRFPDAVEWQLNESKRESLDEPILKKDGNLFEEFYREISKYKLDEATRTFLVEEGKKNSWSYRQLKANISSLRDKQALEPGEDKVLRNEAVRSLISSLKDHPIKHIRHITKLVKEEQIDYENGNI